VWVLRPATPDPWWQAPVGILSGLGTVAAAAAAAAGWHFAHQESQRATRAERALLDEKAATVQALRSQISAEAFALAALLDRWLRGSPWQGDVLPPPLTVGVLRVWGDDLRAARFDLDPRVLSLMSKGAAVPPELRAKLTDVYVRYHFAASVLDVAIDLKQSDQEFATSAILAEHGMQACRQVLASLMGEDFTRSLTAHIEALKADEASQRRNKFIQGLIRSGR